MCGGMRKNWNKLHCMLSRKSKSRITQLNKYQSQGLRPVSVVVKVEILNQIAETGNRIKLMTIKKL